MTKSMKRNIIKLVSLSILIILVIANMLFLIIYPLSKNDNINSFNFVNEVERIKKENNNESLLKSLLTEDSDYYRDHYKDILDNKETINKDCGFVESDINNRYIEINSDANAFFKNGVNITHSIILLQSPISLIHFDFTNISDSIILGINLNVNDNQNDFKINNSLIEIVNNFTSDLSLLNNKNLIASIISVPESDELKGNPIGDKSYLDSYKINKI